MAWGPVLLRELSGASSLPVLTQPASLSASPVTSARLSCTLSSGYNVGDFSLSWFQQKPGSPPWYVVRVNTNTRLSGVPARFSGSVSGNKAALTITGAQPGDEAVPYCALYISPGPHPTPWQPRRG
uniref:Ig-like domain-containing protein n=1 Tax=Capra hircus TaxID=9925 RepID=A0A8C2RLP6_CAPHI